MYKSIFCAFVGSVGGAVAWMFGGWDAALITLLVCMGIDYVTGLIVAGVFHKSKKSANGGLESKAGFKGLLQKTMMLLIIVVAGCADRLLGSTYLRDAVVIAFCANEILSIFENAGLMGVPIPKALARAIDVLKKEGDDEDE